MMFLINQKLISNNVDPYFFQNDQKDNYFSFSRNYDLNFPISNLNFKAKIKTYFKVLKKFFSKDLEYDAIIFMGGGYINRSIGSGYGRLLYIFLLKKLFISKGKKVYFTGQTSGPIQSKIDSFLIKHIYINSTIYTRESKSQELLENLKIKSELTGDDAFLYYQKLATTAKKTSRKYIIVNFKDFKDYNIFDEKMVQMVIEISKELDYDIVLLPFRNIEKYEEYKIHVNIMKKMKNSDINVNLFLTDSVEEIMSLYSQCSFVISTAYHAIVLGLIHNKYVFSGYLGEYYKTKIQGITGFYKKENYKIFDLDKSNSFTYMKESILKNYNKKINNTIVNEKLSLKVNTEWEKIIKEVQNEKRK